MKKKIVFGVFGLSLALILGLLNEPSKAEKAKTRWSSSSVDCVGQSTACAEEIVIWG